MLLASAPDDVPCRRRRLVRRLVAVRDLRAFRPDDPGDDDRSAASCSRTRPHRRVRARTIPFESGVSQGPPQRQRFTVSFYLTAMLFILFDIEIVFLYPLAVILHELALVRVRRVPRLPRHPARRLRLHLAEGSAGVALEQARCASHGLKSERLLWPTKGPGAVRGRGRRASSRSVGLTTLAEGGRLGADELDVAGHVRARLLRDRDDVDRLARATTSRASGWRRSAPRRARPTC